MRPAISRENDVLLSKIPVQMVSILTCKNVTDLRVKLRVQEIVLGIGFAEWMGEESLRCRAFGCITVEWKLD